MKAKKQNYKSIIIDSRDTMFTVDAYQTFTLDAETENELYYYNEEHGTDFDESDFDIDYDMPAYLEALSRKSVEIMSDVTRDHGIIRDIQYIKSSSPSYYNYTTDSFTAELSVDFKALHKFIDARWDDFSDYVQSEWDSIAYRLNFKSRQYETREYIDGQLKDIERPYHESDDMRAAMLDYYTRLCFAASAQSVSIDGLKFDETKYNFESYYEWMASDMYGSEYIQIKTPEASKKL